MGDFNQLRSGVAGQLNAVDVVLNLPLLAQAAASFVLYAGSFIGTLVAEVTYDGTNWSRVFFLNLITGVSESNLIFTSSNPELFRLVQLPPGAMYARVRVLAYTSGIAVGVLYVTPETKQEAPIVLRHTYSAVLGPLAIALNPTDIWAISGAAGRRIRITKIEVSGTQTGAAVRDLFLIKRSTLNVGGVSVPATKVALDSSSPASVASVRFWTANPAVLGTEVGRIKGIRTLIGTAAQLAFPIVWDFSHQRGATAVVLNSDTESVALNLNGVTSTGGLFNITVEWTEE